MEEDKNPILLKDLGMQYPTENSSQKYRFGLYKCGYCGKEFRANSYNIKNSKVMPSCGCQKYRPREKSTTHRLSKHRLYSTWVKMNHRCNNINNKDYHSYGGRGIKVSEEWKDVRNFIEWGEETHKEGLSLDRIDVNGNYEPSNCRWADNFTQAINKRILGTNTSGFVGIDFRPSENKYIARITVYGDRIYLGYFNTIEEAVEARDNYIISNNLPHKLSSEYKKEK